MTEEAMKEVAAHLMRSYALEALDDWVGIAEMIDVPGNLEDVTVDSIREYIRTATVEVTWNGV